MSLCEDCDQGGVFELKPLGGRRRSLAESV